MDGGGGHVAGAELALPSLTLVLTNLSFFSNVKRRIMSFYLFFFCFFSFSLPFFPPSMCFRFIYFFLFSCVPVCVCVSVCVCLVFLSFLFVSFFLFFLLTTFRLGVCRCPCQVTRPPPTFATCKLFALVATCVLGLPACLRVCLFVCVCVCVWNAYVPVFV